MSATQTKTANFWELTYRAKILGQARVSTTLIMTMNHVAGECSMLHMLYLVECSVCRPNVPENTPACTINNTLRMCTNTKISNTHYCTWIKRKHTTKMRKPGLLRDSEAWETLVLNCESWLAARHLATLRIRRQQRQIQKEYGTGAQNLNHEY